MIKLSEGGFAELWGGEKAPETIAISYALQMAVARIIEYADRTKCYAEPEKLSEEALDYFAVEMRSMYYDQSLPLDKKRELVMNTMRWYSGAATPATIKELLGVVFGDGDLEEWFEYDGDPYHFRAAIPVSLDADGDDMRLFLELVQRAKNVRSLVDEIVLDEEAVLKLKTTDGKFRLSPPRCGTIPIVSTGFRQGTMSLILSSAYAEDRSRMPHTGVPKTNQEGGLIK